MTLRMALASIAIATLISTAPAFAQSSMGTVEGTVTDTSGGVLPGAVVTLINVATNVQLIRTTNESGYFVFVSVRPGTYELTIELSGLRPARVAAFPVGVNETVARNVNLAVGDVAEAVTVVGASPLLQRSTS